MESFEKQVRCIIYDIVSDWNSEFYKSLASTGDLTHSKLKQMHDNDIQSFGKEYFSSVWEPSSEKQEKLGDQIRGLSKFKNMGHTCIFSAMYYICVQFSCGVDRSTLSIESYDSYMRDIRQFIESSLDSNMETIIKYFDVASASCLNKNCL